MYAQWEDSEKTVGKLQNHGLNLLWLQDKVHQRETKLVKISTGSNPAHHLTKYLTKVGIEKHMAQTSQHHSVSRHDLAPDIDGRASGFRLI